MRENRYMGFPTRCDSNCHVQSLKMARSLDFGIEEKEGLFYPYSENKGSEQLCSYCTADLRLCFRIIKILVSS